MKSLIIAILTAILSLPGNQTCHAADFDHVGIIKSLAGDVSVARNDRKVKAASNMRLQKGDQIRTGANGKVGLIFEDDTVVSLGPDSAITIENFLFQPNEKRLSFIARIIQGTVSYLSGQIAKLAPNQARLETPHATVGMRGTHVLVKVD